jgi:hypothetical protein|tara:strand:- start:214 stop:654 length:441 start_codon:yes stop_codon:yes gene_type:complete
MKNIKDKKAETNINKLILSLAKNKITKLERNKAEFKLGALYVYLLMLKVNKNKLGNYTKNSKKYICVYMAEQIKEFRMLYLYYKKNKYPRMEKRKRIGIDFYNNIISDKQKNWEASLIFKKLTKHCRAIYTIEEIDRKKYKINIFK